MRVLRQAAIIAAPAVLLLGGEAAGAVVPTQRTAPAGVVTQAAPPIYPNNPPPQKCKVAVDDKVILAVKVVAKYDLRFVFRPGYTNPQPQTRLHKGSYVATSPSATSVTMKLIVNGAVVKTVKKSHVAKATWKKSSKWYWGSSHPRFRGAAAKGGGACSETVLPLGVG